MESVRHSSARRIAGRRRGLARGAAVVLAAAAALAPAGCGGWGSPAAQGPPRPGRVLVIGVDGASWDLVGPMMARGEMDNLRALRERGSHGILASFAPTSSPIIWTTIATGRRPDDHGILGFIRDDPSGRQEHYTNQDRKVRAIWNILTERDRRSNVVGWFTTWPADVIQGAFVSDRSETVEAGGCHPPGLEALLEEVRARVTPEEVHARAQEFFGPDFDRKGLPIEELRAYERLEESIEHYYGVDRLRLEWTARLLREQPAEFNAVFFKGTDPAAHLAWVYMDPEPFRSVYRPRPEALARYGPLIGRYYAFIDRAIGTLLEAAPPGTNVLIVSDHGSGPTVALLAYHANPLLARLGWLATGGDGRPDPPGSLLIDPTPRGREGQVSRRLVVNRHVLPERAPDPASRRALVGSMADRLRSLRTLSGEPVFTEVAVAGGEGAGDVDSIRYAIDVTFNSAAATLEETPRGVEIAGRYRLDGELHPLTDLVSVRWEKTGGHRINGLLAMAGPYVREGVELPKTSVYDVAPTLLRILGLPPSREMSGRVIVEGLREELMGDPGPPVRSYERPEPIPRVLAPALPEVEEELERRLETLGYIQ